MEAEEVDVGRASSAEQRRHLLGVDAELLRAAAHPHPGALDLEVGVDADGDPRPDAEPLARLEDTRSASVSDSISMVTPAATAWPSSAGVLPGPGEADALGPASACRARSASRAAEATSKESTSPARCWTTAGIGLALTA